MLAKWLACRPQILVLNGPTVGVDIGSKHDIHAILQSLAGKGMAVIIISDDLPELLEKLLAHYDSEGRPHRGRTDGG